MEAHAVIIEAHVDGAWEEAAELVLREPHRGRKSRTQLTYQSSFISRHIDHLGTQGACALSERLPLDFEVWSSGEWPAFLLDLVPTGAARRWWARELAGKPWTEPELDFVLLRDHTTAPIGHLRVASARVRDAEPIAFTKEEVCRRDTDFLEHAAQLGVAIGGATGAGGDAPKVLLVEDAQGDVYPEGVLPDEAVCTSWLVKWPRGRDTDRDRLVLRAEYLFAHALETLGLDVCAGQWHHLEGSKPSLWLERFDRRSSPGGLERVPVESFYSLAGVTQPGATVTHEAFLEAVREALARRAQLASLPEITHELVRRDLVDVLLGNTDNHGRNRAVLRGAQLRLAPIYDLAPMVVDPEGITRSTRWRDHERGGRIDYPSVCRALDVWLGTEGTLEALRAFAHRLRALPEVLREAGLPEEVFASPRIYLDELPETLDFMELA